MVMEKKDVMKPLYGPIFSGNMKVKLMNQGRKI